MNITRAGVGLIASGLVGVGVGLVFGILELFLLTAMCIAAFAFAVVFIFLGSPKVEVSRESRPFKLRAYSEGEIVLALSNKGNRPTSVLQAIDKLSGKTNAKVTIASLPAGGSVKMSYRTPELKRGMLVVGPMKLLIQDPLGLIRKTVKSDSISNFLVRPYLSELPELTAVQGTLKSTFRRVRSTKQGDDDFYALRPYVLGDDLRKVNWRAAAKSDDLLVIQEKKIEQGAITIVLDASPTTYDSQSFERAVSAACSVLHSAYKGKDLVKFYISDSPNPHIVDNDESLEEVEKKLSLLVPNKNSNFEKILESLSKRSVGGTLITIFGGPTPAIAGAVQRCKYLHKQSISITCNPLPNSNNWAIPYDGQTPLPIVWNKALAVSKV